MQKYKSNLDSVIVDLEQVRDLLSLAFEETNSAGINLDINKSEDVTTAFCYARRAHIMASLINAVDTSLMLAIDELDDLNNEQTA